MTRIWNKITLCYFELLHNFVSFESRSSYFLTKLLMFRPMGFLAFSVTIFSLEIVLIKLVIKIDTKIHFITLFYIRNLTILHSQTWSFSLSFPQCEQTLILASSFSFGFSFFISFISTVSFSFLLTSFSGLSVLNFDFPSTKYSQIIISLSAISASLTQSIKRNKLFSYIKDCVWIQFSCPNQNFSLRFLNNMNK